MYLKLFYLRSRMLKLIQRYQPFFSQQSLIGDMPGVSVKVKKVTQILITHKYSQMQIGTIFKHRVNTKSHFKHS